MKLKKLLLALVCVVVLTGGLSGCMEAINNTINTAENTTGDYTQPADSWFEVHFIDVGQADAELVGCDGHWMLIDGGNRADSDLMYSYLKKLGITELDYVVGSHAHEDHIGGIAGALAYAKAKVVMCPVTSYDSKAFTNFLKAVDKQGLEVTVPKYKDTFTLGTATVTVLGPITYNSSTSANNTSIVLKVSYGNTSFVFAGDAEREEEEDILDVWGQDIGATVLKVSHHGSNTGTTYPWLRSLMPQYAVIEVGKDNDYGHPADSTLSKLKDAGVVVYRTDLQGDIICKSDGNIVTFSTAKTTTETALNTGGGQN